MIKKIKIKLYQVFIYIELRRKIIQVNMNFRPGSDRSFYNENYFVTLDG